MSKKNDSKDLPDEYELWGEKVRIHIPNDKFPTEEERSEMESRVPGCCHGWFPSTSKNGEKLHYQYFIPSSVSSSSPPPPPKAVLVFEHGIRGSISTAWVLEDGTKLNMALLVDFFVKEKGYALYALDMLGHGYSEGERFIVPDYKINRDDLAKFARFVSNEKHPKIPFFIHGESYGANLCVHVARLFQDDETPNEYFGGMCLTAPALQGNLPPAPVVFTLRRILAPTFPRWTPFFMPNPVSADRIWTDERVRLLNMDPRRCEMGLSGPGQPFELGTAAQLLNAVDDVRGEAGIITLKIPFCAVHGKLDFAVPVGAIDYLEKHAKTDPEDSAILRFEEAYHDILGSIEFSRPAVEFWDKFIQKRIEQIKVATSAKIF